METFHEKLRAPFEPSVDFISKWTEWKDGEQVILCYYSTLVKKIDVQRLLMLYENSNEPIIVTVEKFDLVKLQEHVCNAETVVVRPRKNEMICFNVPDIAHGEVKEPMNETVLRGSREGFVGNFDINISLIRKKMRDSTVVVKNIVIGQESKINVYYVYRKDIVDEGALELLEQRLQKMKDIETFYINGQLLDQLEDQVLSPFPQILITERSDRVIASLAEGRISVFTDLSPSAYIAPVTFFSFYESPDDFTNRVLVGSFYKLLRYASFLVALFLPAIYIATISYNFEIMPIELAAKVKEDVSQIPYRPFVEAMFMELTIEIIREASIRLPQPIGQTIGIVGGLVIGDSVVNAGLVSNLMVIVVAFTAISSFVIPNVEMNTTIRLLRFPFMMLASVLGFFGIIIGVLILFIHLLNLSSLKRPYLDPIVPFNAKKLLSVLIRLPNTRASSQSKTFSKRRGQDE